MATRRKEDLEPDLAHDYDLAVAEYAKRFPKDPQPFISCAYRTNEEQLALFNQPKDGKDNNGNGIIDDASEKVTQAKPGQSPHNYLPSFAFDIAFINPLTQKIDWNIKYFKQFADCMASVSKRVSSGINWEFKDAPHHEISDWKVRLQTRKK